VDATTALDESGKDTVADYSRPVHGDAEVNVDSHFVGEF
jgi:hypothetical protein